MTGRRSAGGSRRSIPDRGPGQKTARASAPAPRCAAIATLATAAAPIAGTDAALVGSVLAFNAMQLMGAVGVGIAADAGTGIVTDLAGTAIV